MDGQRSRAANSESSGWESAKFHAMIVWEITYAIIVSSPPNAMYSRPGLSAWVESLEKEVYASARDQDDYNSNMARWIMSMDPWSQIPGLNPLATFNNPTEIASSSSGENGRDAYACWQEALFFRIQRLASMFFSKFPNWCRLAVLLSDQRDSAPQRLRTAHIVRSNLVFKLLESIVLCLDMTGGQISPTLKQKLDRLERLITSVLRRRRNVSSHHRHRPPPPPSVPLQSGVSQENLSELPLMTPQSSLLSKRKSVDDFDDDDEEEPKKLMKREVTEYIFSVLKHETP